MKIIGFSASPRGGSNSEALLDELLKGAREAGAGVEKVHLNSMDINPCQACALCRPKGPGKQCVVQDDMQLIYDQLREADVWVLATPVYWWGPSSQLKLMVDRWYGSPLTEAERSQKRAALVLSLGDDDHKTAHPTIDMFTCAFEYLGIKFYEPLVVTADIAGEVLGNSAALRQAYALGRQIAGESQ